MKYHRLLLLPFAFAFAVQGAPKTPQQAALAAREQRADLLLDEIKALDARIEGRVEHLIDGLAGITDSKDSKTKVARIKEDTVQALIKNMGYYQTRRASIQDQLRRPTLNLTPEQKQKILAALDARVEKRVQQILALEKSFPSHKDYEKYKVTPGGNWWGGDSISPNPDFEQNRRVTTYTRQMQGKVVDGLKQSISRLEQQQRSLQNAPADPVTNAEIARNDALLSERRVQLDATLSDARQDGKEVNLKQAVDLDAALRKAGTELRKDFDTLFARYASYLPALADANTARAGIAKP